MNTSLSIIMRCAFSFPCLLSGLLVGLDSDMVSVASASPVARPVERLRNEAVVGWNELRRLQSQSEFVVNEPMTEKRAGKPARTIDRKYVVSFNEQSFLYTSGDNNAHGGNPQYSFRVQRRSARDPWFAALVNEHHGEKNSGDDVASAVGRLPWSLFDAPLESIVNDPTFKVIQADESPDGLVTIRFQIKSNQQNQQIKRLRGGRFTCAPAKNWAVQSSEIEVQGTSLTKVTESIVYGPPSTEYLNLLGTSNRTSWQDEQGENEVLWESQISSKRGDLPPEAFTLSAFGLPEPGHRPQRSRFWLWMNVAAVILLILGWGWRRRQIAGS